MFKKPPGSQSAGATRGEAASNGVLAKARPPIFDSAYVRPLDEKPIQRLSPRDLPIVYELPKIGPVISISEPTTARLFELAREHDSKGGGLLSFYRAKAVLYANSLHIEGVPEKTMLGVRRMLVVSLSSEFRIDHTVPLKEMILRKARGILQLCGIFEKPAPVTRKELSLELSGHQTRKTPIPYPIEKKQEPGEVDMSTYFHELLELYRT